MVFDEDESDNDETTIKGLKTHINFDEERINHFRELMLFGHNKAIKEASIEVLQWMFDDNKIKVSMTKAEIEKYIEKTYETNFKVKK